MVETAVARFGQLIPTYQSLQLGAALGMTRLGLLLGVLKQPLIDTHLEDSIVSRQVMVQYNFIAKSVSTIALGMFCGEKHTHHTFMLVIKTLNYNNSKHLGKKSLINKYMQNPTDIKLCISHTNCLVMRSTS